MGELSVCVIADEDNLNSAVQIELSTSPGTAEGKYRNNPSDNNSTIHVRLPTCANGYKLYYLSMQSLLISKQFRLSLSSLMLGLSVW